MTTRIKRKEGVGVDLQKRSCAAIYLKSDVHLTIKTLSDQIGPNISYAFFQFQWSRHLVERKTIG